MKQKSLTLLHILFSLLFLSGCSATDTKTGSTSVIYAVCTVLSLIVLIVYCYVVRQKDVWFLLLFGAILVANIGYLSLSVSQNLEEALLANRIAYLGSVFLPLAVLMIILRLSKISYKSWLPGVLTAFISFVFLICASPGYSDIYYKEVTFEIIDGIPTLHKVYGLWHNLYLIYVLSFFAILVGLVLYVITKKKTASVAHAVILSVAVGINIAVWILERYVNISFELLTVTYLFTGIFLLALHIMILENERLRALAYSTASATPTEKDFVEEAAPIVSDNNTTKTVADDNSTQQELFLKGLEELTPAERTIYDYYIAGKNTSEIMIALNIKENTLKFHNKNIYSKLGVSSRKQLIEIYKQLN